MSLSTVSAALFIASASMDVGLASCDCTGDLRVHRARADSVSFYAPPVLTIGMLDTTVPRPEIVNVTPASGPAASPPAGGAGSTGTSVAAKPVDEGDEIVVTGRLRPPREDPAQAINMASFVVVQAIDQAVMRPAALTYEKFIPSPIRDGVRNFLDHLTEPVNAVNYLLQFKIGRMFETIGRFAINSTLGVVGIFDIAKRKPFRLPYRQNGFADTLGFYGVKPGPFIYLPLIGPTTVRDLAGIFMNRSFLPAVAGRPFNQPWFFIPTASLGQLDKRAQFDEELQRRRVDSRGAYTATREDYLERRQIHIDALRGKFDPKNYPPPRLVPTVTPKIAEPAR